MNLDGIAIALGTDKATVHSGGNPHGYTPHYEWFFAPKREEKNMVLEIGVAGGESIRTWLEYFPNSQVCGIDNNPDAAKIDDPRYEFVLGDQGSDEFWSRFIQSHWFTWDIVIDDGSHEPQHVETTFRQLWKMVKPGGVYCIEDVFVFYNKLAPDNGRAFVSRLVSAVHHTVWKDPNYSLDGLEKDIESIHLSPGLVILRKTSANV